MSIEALSPGSVEKDRVDVERTAFKHTKKFSWRAVSARVLRELLTVAYDEKPDEVRKLKKQSEKRLTELAHSIYGSPPTMGRLDFYPGAWDVLQDTWAVREADRGLLGHLVNWASLGVPVAEREPDMHTLKDLRGFVGRRNKTDNFKANLRKFFIQAHKIPQPVRGRTAHGRSQGGLPLRVQLLRGMGLERGHVPYPHQREAEEALDRLVMNGPDERRGLVILPTGAGKTSTVVDWILPRIAGEKSLRVLWLAHQEELLLQAAGSFRSAAAREKPGFERRLRIISSGGSPSSTLVEDDLDVALITWQTLYNSFDEQKRSKKLEKFLDRPTIVVVDEAHRAAAAGYQKILDTVRSSNPVGVIGLTATPWPGQYGAAARLKDSFPTVVIQKTIKEMLEQQILAVPVYSTVDTGEVLTLTEAETRQARGDLPTSVLRRVATARRDALLLDKWRARANEWGKTLVFATTREHADRLGYLFEDAGLPVKVLHSGTSGSSAEVLKWFREQQKPVVLVSVGMLTEGVDLPDAHTAFLARPTTSRILLRQMIGRVLRGEQAGGSRTAHVVYFRDHWADFDAIARIDEEYQGEVETGLPGPPLPGQTTHRLPPVVDEDSGIPIGEDILAQVRRMYSQQLAEVPVDPAISKTELVGYYELLDQNVPVMSHQVDGYRELIAQALRGGSFQGRAGISLFDDDHPPYPTPRMVNAVVDHVRMFQEDPSRLFHPLRAGVSPLEVAKDLRNAAEMTFNEQDEWLHNRFESSLARLAFRTFDHFDEAVRRELRDGSRGTVERVDESMINATLPVLRRSNSRDLPSLKHVTRLMRLHLAREVVLARVDEANLPDLAWSKRTRKDAWAYWSLRTAGRGKGKPVIRVNLALRAAKKHVPDQL